MPPKVSFPGYQQIRPSFQSVKNLWRLLGEQDSCFQANQVSLAFLENFIKTYELNESDFTKTLSKKFHISGAQKNWTSTNRFMSYSYVVQTYNIQELFFKDFNKEYRTYKKKNSWVSTIKDGDSDKNLDPYAQLIHNIEQAKSNKFVDTPESKIIQYYRFVRIAVVHSTKDNKNRANEYFDRNIAPIKSHFEGYFKFKVDDSFPAPNRFDEINHYDFSIYSRSLRYLAYLINDACDLSAQEIFDVIMQTSKFSENLAVYNFLADKHLKKKLENKLLGYFKSHYSGNVSDGQEFCRLYIDWYENEQKKSKKRGKKN